MKICLVRPPTFVSNERVHPYNLECLSRSLTQRGHEVSLVDAELMADTELSASDDQALLQRFVQRYFVKQKMVSRMGAISELFEDMRNTFFRKVVDAVLSTDPDMIGFSCYSSGMASTKRILNLLSKSGGSDRRVVLGGIHPTSVPLETMINIPEANYAAVGEGESILTELVDRIENGDVSSLSKVKGLVYRNDTNEIRFSDEPCPPITLETLPIPEWDHAGPQYDHYAVMTSRGCAFNCSFCASKKMWGRRVRFRPANHIVPEIKNLMKKTDSRSITIADDTFTLSKSHMVKVCNEMLNAGIDDIWLSIGSRIDTIDKDKIDIAKRMGVREIAFGIESGSQRILDFVDKRIEVKNVIPTIRMVNNNGIYTNTFFMLNHPNETFKDMTDTVTLINELNSNCKLNTVTLNIGFPYPGTPWWDYCSEKGLSQLIDFYKYSYRYNHQMDPAVNMTSESIDTVLAFAKLIDKIEMNRLMRVRWRKVTQMLFLSPRRLFKRILVR